MIRQPGRTLLGTGLLAVAAAVGWWGLSYGQVWHNDYISLPEASRCLVADSAICRLATSLCGARHAAGVAVYSPILFWIGLALACASALAPRRATSMAALTMPVTGAIASSAPAGPVRACDDEALGIPRSLVPASKVPSGL